MLTRNQLKDVKALQQKKHRRELGLFVVEGGKSVAEVLASDFAVTAVYATAAFAPELEKACAARKLAIQQATAAQLAEMGSYESNDAALAVVRMRPAGPIHLAPGEYVLALDDIRDPGNLGTLLRTADWYGIRQVICSPETAELYNPKVIAASMGSFTRLAVHYADLPAFLAAHPERRSYGAFLDGEDLHQTRFATQGGILVIGNEAHGIAPALAAAIHTRLTIPRYGQAESLNAGIAGAVLLDNWRRNTARQDGRS
ncbi:MAG: RNA methyltransferase [Gammaproteobacteria bacterium]|nr:RNA methyltransferase [Gammaproteobacteria bacterium]